MSVLQYEGATSSNQQLIQLTYTDSQMDEIRQNIKDFKTSSGVDKVVVLWTANTERYSDITEGLNDTADNFLKAIDNNESEVAPSSIFAAACIHEGEQYSYDFSTQLRKGK